MRPCDRSARTQAGAKTACGASATGRRCWPRAPRQGSPCSRAVTL